MKMKIYLFRFAVAVAAFVFGISLLSVGRYFQTVFSAKESKAEAPVPVEVEMVKAEDLIYPPIVQPETTLIETAKTAQEPEEETAYKFHAHGEYYIIGGATKVFEKFDYLYIETLDYEKASVENDHMGIPIPPKGVISSETGKELNLVRINISNELISFETEKKNGVSFQFVGKFIDEEELKIDEYTHYVVLEGILTKMKNGEKIVERSVQFGYMDGC